MKRSLRFKPLHVSFSVRDGYLYEVQRRGEWGGNHFICFIARNINFGIISTPLSQESIIVIKK